jgi:hypothetical protein
MEPVESNTSHPPDQPARHPRRVSNVVAYLLDRTWLGERPDFDSQPEEFTAVYDEIFRIELRCGVRVRALRLGIIVFDFSNSIFASTATEHSPLQEISESALRRLSVINSHVLCLATAIKRLHNFVSRSQYVRLNDLLYTPAFEHSDNLFSSPHSEPPQAYSRLTARFFQTAAAGEVLFHNALSHWRAESYRGSLVGVDALTESFSILDDILSHENEQLCQLIDLLAQSGKAFEEHNFSLSLILAWAVSENFLSKTWQNFLQQLAASDVEIKGERVGRLSAARRDRLLDNRTFSASVILETLELAGALPHELYQFATVARKARNDWIHGLRRTPRSDEASSAIRLATALLQRVEGIELDITPFLSIHYQLGGN